MLRVFVVHWRMAEAASLIEVCRKAGFAVEYNPDGQSGTGRAIRNSLPDAVVIDLSRLPSHGREIAVWMRGLQATRHIPIVFVNGTIELPDMTCTTESKLPSVLKKVAGKPVVNAAVPLPMMKSYGDRSAAQKLGIKAGMKIEGMNAPRNFPSLFAELPEGVEVGKPAVVTLCFIEDAEVLMASIARLRTVAAKSKLWICWRKGTKIGATQKFILATARDAGLVDYKVCSVNEQWSAMAFALRS